jgi:hypothetical protein
MIITRATHGLPTIHYTHAMLGNYGTIEMNGTIAKLVMYAMIKSYAVQFIW